VYPGRKTAGWSPPETTAVVVLLPGPEGMAADYLTQAGKGEPELG
jgi:hypothetical protein